MCLTAKLGCQLVFMDPRTFPFLSVPFYRFVGVIISPFRSPQRKSTATILKLNNQPPNKPSLLDVVKSVAASALGVQSAANRERDFQQQSVVPYIVVGVFFVILFIMTLLLIVSLVLP